jgi:hypothetical protein
MGQSDTFSLNNGWPFFNHQQAKCTANPFSIVAGDSRRRLLENGHKIGDRSRLQSHFEELIGPEAKYEVAACAASRGLNAR